MVQNYLLGYIENNKKGVECRGHERNCVIADTHVTYLYYTTFGFQHTQAFGNLQVTDDFQK